MNFLWASLLRSTIQTSFIVSYCGDISGYLLHYGVSVTEYFLMFDTDGDQKIEKTELKTLLRVVYKQTPDDAMVDKCLQQFDTDGKQVP